MCAARTSLHPPQPLWKEVPLDQLSLEQSKELSLEALLLHFLRGGRLVLSDATRIAESVLPKLRAEQNVLRLNGKFIIVGDMHGQFFDFAKILKLNGLPPATRYLFLGNCIGGGGFNCETFLFLLAAKMRYPDNIFILRGPHESCYTSSAFGFEEECTLKYSKKIYTLLLRVFESLPLAAVLNQIYFCVHGGLSPDIEYIETIVTFNRFQEVPQEGPICDLLWADPHWDVDNPLVPVERSPSDEYYTPGTQYHDLDPDFSPNKKRGRSYIFNFASIKYFMSRNKILCIIRSHEVEDSGYKLYRSLPSTNYPCMISVFSAPNYGGSFENMGAVLSIGEELTIKKFFSSPCPFSLPKTNCFLWSGSFVEKNVKDIFEKIIGT